MYALAAQTMLGDAVAAVQRYAPSVLGFAALVLAGWLSARLLGRWTRRIVGKTIDRVGRGPAVSEALRQSAADTTIPRVIGAFVFWVVLLIFLAAAIDVLGLASITDLLSRIVFYLPNAVAGVLIVLAGLIGGVFARNATAKSAMAAGLPRAEIVARAVQFLVVTIAVVVALEQIGVTGRLLVILVATAVGTMFAGAGLAFGLGARGVVSNIVASYYVTQNYRPGQRIRIGGVEGPIIRTTPTAVVVETADGQCSIPAHRFEQEASLLVNETAR